MSASLETMLRAVERLVADARFPSTDELRRRATRDLDQDGIARLLDPAPFDHDWRVTQAGLDRLGELAPGFQWAFWARAAKLSLRGSSASALTGAIEGVAREAESQILRAMDEPRVALEMYQGRGPDFGEDDGEGEDLTIDSVWGEASDAES
jgi:hypothetical protein